MADAAAPAEAPAVVDTNVLLYAADASARFHVPSRALWDRARAGDIALAVTPQILWEYFSLITSPKRVTAALAPEDAWSDIERFRVAFQIIQPPVDIVERVLALSRTASVRGPEVFDATIALTAIVSGIGVIYSYDPSVFSRVPGIEVKEP